MVMTDAAGLILLVNAETEELFGYQREELLGREVEVLVPERYRAQHPHLRARFLTSPEARRMGAGRDLFGLRKDGSEFPVEIGLNPLETDEGPVRTRRHRRHHRAQAGRGGAAHRRHHLPDAGRDHDHRPQRQDRARESRLHQIDRLQRRGGDRAHASAAQVRPARSGVLRRHVGGAGTRELLAGRASGIGARTGQCTRCG